MSNETKFTKGEWVVSHAHDDVSVAMGDAVESPYEYTTGHLWQCDVYWSEADEEDVANAHLISAAPNLYDALDGLLSRMENDKECKHWFIDEQAAAIKALAKARGDHQ